jgi:hypothetical protein
VLAYERVQLADEVAVAAGSQIDLDPILEAGQPRFFQAGDLELREALVAKVGEGCPSPQGERLGGLPFFTQALEAVDVELAGLDAEKVAGGFRLEAFPAERLAELGDIDLQGLLRRLGWLLFPERIDQAIGGDHPVRLQEQHGQEGALLPAAQVAHLAPCEHLERTQDAKLHHREQRSYEPAPWPGAEATERGLCRRGLTSLSLWFPPSSGRSAVEGERRR